MSAYTWGLAHTNLPYLHHEITVVLLLTCINNQIPVLHHITHVPYILELDLITFQGKRRSGSWNQGTDLIHPVFMLRPHSIVRFTGFY